MATNRNGGTGKIMEGGEDRNACINEATPSKEELARSEWSKKLSEVVGQDIVDIIDPDYLLEFIGRVKNNLDCGERQFILYPYPVEKSTNILKEMEELVKMESGGETEADERKLPLNRLEKILGSFQARRKPLFDVELHKAMISCYKKIEACGDENPDTNLALKVGIIAYRQFTLILKPPVRHSLFFLLEFLHKLSRKNEMVLDARIPNQHFLTSLFCQVVIGADKDEEMNSSARRKIVYFMIEFYHYIFDDKNIQSLGSEDTLKVDVEKCEDVKVKPSASSSASSSIPSTNQSTQGSWCKQISMGEFSNQGLFGKSPELRKLFKSFSTSETRSLSDRIKFLTAFREENPLIFKEEDGEKILAMLIEQARSEKSKGTAAKLLKQIQDFFQKK